MIDSARQSAVDKPSASRSSSAARESASSSPAAEP